jgi:hypothetical protein
MINLRPLLFFRLHSSGLPVLPALQEGREGPEARGFFRQGRKALENFPSNGKTEKARSRKKVVFVSEALHVKRFRNSMVPFDFAERKQL